MLRNRLPLLILVSSLGACERPGQADPSAQVSRALSGMLVYPGSQQVSMSAGDQAAQLTLTTPDSLPLVAVWYRRLVLSNKGTLENDIQSPDGSVSMMATLDGRPFWITLQPNVGAVGTTYTLIGALPSDSAAAAKPDKAIAQPRAGPGHR